MRFRKLIAQEKGVTLIAVVLLVLSIGIIAFIGGALAVKLQEINKERNTVKRMAVIKAALKKYYRGHQELPAPSNVLKVNGDDRGVPVADLNLEQRFSIDDSGQFFYYNRVLAAAFTLDEIDFPEMTDIDGLRYRTSPSDPWRNIAGIVISNGPNQQLDTDINGNDYTSKPAGVVDDDIVVPINLMEEAREIAQEELQVLLKKVNAFNKFYAGVDNDEDNCGSSPPPPPPPCEVDEAQRIFRNDSLDNFILWQFYGEWWHCPPANRSDISSSLPAIQMNDPNNGYSTLDALKNGVHWVSVIVNTIIFPYDDYGQLSPLDPCLFRPEIAPPNWSQGDDGPVRWKVCTDFAIQDGFRIDPWLNGYVWGAPTSDSLVPFLVSNPYPSGQVPIDGNNPRFHKFFSMGPDGDTSTKSGDAGNDTDDIIP